MRFKAENFDHGLHEKKKKRKIKQVPLLLSNTFFDSFFLLFIKFIPRA